MNRKNPNRRRSGAKKLIAACVVAGIALSGAVAFSATAGAATAGPGYGTQDNVLGWQGAFVAPDGSLVYCFEPGTQNPFNATEDRGLTTNAVAGGDFGSRALTPDDHARINYLVSTFGQTSSNREASAVAFAVKAIANSPAMYQAHGYPNNAQWPTGDLQAFVEWTFGAPGVDDGADAAEATAVGNRAVELYNSAMSITAGTAEGGAGELRFRVDSSNNYLGEVAMEGTDGATGTITLVNGVFETTGTNTLVGAQEGVAYEIHGVPPTDDGADYKISGTGTFTAPGSGWAPNFHLWDTPGQQQTAGPGTAAMMQFDVAGEDPTVRGVQFLPVLRTTAPVYVDREAGEAFTDVVNFSTAADENGTNNDWFVSSRGNYAPVTANGTLYGPFVTQPAESDTVPADAPVAGTATITTDLATGPTVPYTATFDSAATQSGFYVIQWVIDWNGQNGDTQRVVPGPSEGNEDQAPYYFADRFGQVVESSLVPAEVTTKAQPAAKPTETLVDVATVTGSLPTGDGANLGFEAFEVPQKEDPTRPGVLIPDAPEGTDPTDLSWVCTDENRVFETEPVNITAAGEYTSAPYTTEDRGATILWVETLTDLEGVVLDRGECGEPSEVSHVLEVSTVARSSASTTGVVPDGTEVWDTAAVVGSIPTNTQVIVEAFRVPRGAAPVCTDETKVWTSEPIDIPAGVYTEPYEVETNRFVPKGDLNETQILFVEKTIERTDGDILSQGRCGEESESLLFGKKAVGMNLVSTGGDLAGIGLAAGGLAVLGAVAGAAALVIHRRKVNA